MRLLVLWLLLLVSAEAGPITALVFTPDGTNLISNGPRCLIVRSPHDGTETARIPCELPKITALAFHGSMLAIAGGTPRISGAVWLMDWKSRTILHRWSDLSDLATSIAFDASGSRLIVASADETARNLTLNDGPTLREKFILRGHAGPVLAAAFTPGDRTVVTASADRSVKVWSAEDGRLIRTFTQHTESIHALAIRPSRSDAPATIATAGDDRTLRVWQPEIGRMVRIVRNHEAPIFAVSYSRDGNSLFTAGREGIIRRIDADSDAVLEHWHPHNEAIFCLTVSPDGTTLASGDWAGAVKIRNIGAASIRPR